MTDDELVTRYIDPNPDRPSDAWLIGYGVSVWALIQYLRAAEGDCDRVTADYDLPREAFEAALAYYRRNKALIDARIALNAA